MRNQDHLRARDESGIALPLAIIMIVLVGVMGAGLLTFVTTDLTSVTSVNKGQRAFELADAGVQAAKHQLTSDNNRNTNYDGSGQVSNDSESQWSYKISNSSCGETGNTGVCLKNLDGSSSTTDRVNITIQCSVSGSGCSSSDSTFKVISTGQYEDAKRRIEATFDIQAGGTAGLPQMVYAVKPINGDRLSLDGSTPNANGNPSGMIMYSKGNITFDQDDIILNNASMFSGGDITLMIQNSRNIVVSKPKKSSQYVVTQNNCNQPDKFQTLGTDPLGNWSNSFNTTARKTNLPGMGAVGNIKDINDPNKKPCGWGTQFFDHDTNLFQNSNPKAQFVDTPSNLQTTGQITFPFDKNVMDATDPTTGQTKLEKTASGLEAAARAQTKQYSLAGDTGKFDSSGSQGNFINLKGGISDVAICDSSNPGCRGQMSIVWPNVPASTPVSQWPVIYVRFNDKGSNNKVSWSVLPNPQPQFSGGSDPGARCQSARQNYPTATRRGILVVENGSVDLPGTASPLDGGIVTIGEPNSHNRDLSGSAGDFCVRGPVLVDGEIQRNNYTGLAALPQQDYIQLPGFGSGSSSVKQRSWRELYQ